SAGVGVRNHRNGHPASCSRHYARRHSYKSSYCCHLRHESRGLHIGQGPDHPDIATSLNNLAYLLQAQGEPAAARLPLFERALAIQEKVLGPDHPDTALSLNNLAILLQAQGELAAARPLLERTLAIR